MTLSSYYLDVQPVTVTNFQVFCGATGELMPGSPPWNAGWTNRNLAMVNVTWNQAAAYAAWVGKRLPTEAEYEYAMRSGRADSLYPWGDTISSGNANYGNAVGQPTPAGTYPTNAYGLYDIAGNVWEWCSDWYQSTLTGPVTDPTGPATGTNKTIRGGSYISSPLRLRCGARYTVETFAQYVDLGFRCASPAGAAGGSPSAPPVPGNLNGVPGWWAQWFFGVDGYFDAQTDSDHDGLNNGQEYAAGTDPTQAGSVLELRGGQPASSSGGFVIKWSSVTGKRYTVERAAELKTGFGALATNVTATPPENTYTDSTGTNGPHFYRIKTK